MVMGGFKAEINILVYQIESRQVGDEKQLGWAAGFSKIYGA